MKRYVCAYAVYVEGHLDWERAVFVDDDLLWFDSIEEYAREAFERRHDYAIGDLYDVTTALRVAVTFSFPRFDKIYKFYVKGMDGNELFEMRRKENGDLFLKQLR